jgi:hypothetical protein
MAYKIRNGLIGSQAIADTSTTQNHPFGTIVTADDPTNGTGEFIYLKGVASTVVGSWVTYKSDDWTTALVVPDNIGPVAVAMSINDAATDYGWYQIHGKASAKAADVADNGLVYIDTDAGICDDAVVAGDKVHNATWASADDTATGLADVEIARPFCTDEST